MAERRRATLSALSVLLAEHESATSPGSVGSLQLAGPGCSIAVAAHGVRPLQSPGGSPTIAKGRLAPMGQLVGAMKLTKSRAPTTTHTEP